MKFFLGVDGGATATTALVGDESGRIVGEGKSGPSNAAENLTRVLREAVNAAVNGEQMEFEAACFGLSGGADNKDAAVRVAVRARLCSVTHDALIALVGATGGEPGVVTIAGTGSMAFGRNAEGRTARAGGWGYAFGDEGSAFDIARQAVRAALRIEEGWGAKTALIEALKEAAGAPSANALLHGFYTPDFSRARVAGFAPLVDEIARAGDAVATDILKSAAQALATIALAVRGQLFGADETVTLSYTGGAFNSAILLERFRMLVELNDRNHVTPPKYRPSEGALIEAYRLAGVDITQCGKPIAARNPLPGSPDR